MGRLPAYIYSDIAWIPYENTHADMRTFGWVFNLKEYKNLYNTLNDLKRNITDISQRINIVKKLRNSHYSYEGVARQILLYLNHGESKSDLRCHGYPKKG